MILRVLTEEVATLEPTTRMLLEAFTSERGIFREIFVQTNEVVEKMTYVFTSLGLSFLVVYETSPSFLVG